MLKAEQNKIYFIDFQNYIMHVYGMRVAFYQQERKGRINFVIIGGKIWSPPAILQNKYEKACALHNYVFIETICINVIFNVSVD